MFKMEQRCPKQQAENKEVFALGLTFFTKNAENDFFSRPNYKVLI